MTVSVSSTHMDNLLKTTFSDTSFTSAYALVYARLCSGTMPSNPTVTTGFGFLSSVVSLGTTSWLPPSNGVSMLSAPIAITPTGSGIATFIRLSTSNDPAGVGGVDISLGLSGSGASCIASVLSVTTGVAMSITDLRIKLNTVGDLSVSNSIANYLLRVMTGQNNTQPQFLFLGAMSKFNELANDWSKSVIVDVYSGAIPASADDVATGTKLWTKTITSNNLFTHGGLGMSLAATLTANAIATGTPTYFRATKAAYTGASVNTGLTTTWPATVIQGPVGLPLNGCVMNSPTLTTGVSATMTNLTITLRP